MNKTQTLIERRQRVWVAIFACLVLPAPIDLTLTTIFGHSVATSLFICGIYLVMLSTLVIVFFGNLGLSRQIERSQDEARETRRKLLDTVWVTPAGAEGVVVDTLDDGATLRLGFSSGLMQAYPKSRLKAAPTDQVASS